MSLLLAGLLSGLCSVEQEGVLSQRTVPSSPVSPHLPPVLCSHTLAMWRHSACPGSFLSKANLKLLWLSFSLTSRDMVALFQYFPHFTPGFAFLRNGKRKKQLCIKMIKATEQAI